MFPQNPDETNVSEGRANEGFSGSEFSLVGDKTNKLETEPMESQTSSQAELESETKEPEGTSNLAQDDTRESTPQQSEDQFSLFSSELFAHDADVSKESPSSSPIPSTEPTPAGETLTAAAAAIASQDAEPSTSAEDLNASRGNKFWDKARHLASQRRRSRLEHNRVLSTEGGKILMCISYLRSVPNNSML